MSAPPDALAGPRHLLIPRPGTQALVIFFAAINMTPGRFNFKAAGRALDANVLFLNNGRNAWYQDGVPGIGADFDDTVDTLRRWAGALGAKRILTVGASMGGYAAILFATRIGGAALAFSADTRLRDRHSRSAKLLAGGTELRFPDLRPLVEAAGTPITLVLGEMDAVDVVSARHLGDLPSVTVRSLRGVGHDAASYLKSTGRLQDLLAIFLAGRPVPEFTEAGRACAIKGLGEALAAADERVAAQDWTGAESRARAALGLHANSEAAHFVLGKALARQGRSAEAVPHLAIVTSLTPQFLPAIFEFGNVLRALGEPAQALEMLRRYPPTGPQAARCEFAMGQIYASMGRIADAIAHVRKATERDPTVENFTRRLASLEALRG